MSSPGKRRDLDIMKLRMQDFNVRLINESADEFTVDFDGPKNTLYEDGVWKVRILIPVQYPYKSPSIGFENKIFHPNIDEESGSVCLNVLNKTWSPMYDLVNIFQIFLPQLLTYPNAEDPLNVYAGELMSKNLKLYEETVKDYVTKYATQKCGDGEFESESSDESSDELSSISSDEYY